MSNNGENYFVKKMKMCDYVNKKTTVDAKLERC